MAVTVEPRVFPHVWQRKAKHLGSIFVVWLSANDLWKKIQNFFANKILLKLQLNLHPSVSNKISQKGNFNFETICHDSTCRQSRQNPIYGLWNHRHRSPRRVFFFTLRWKEVPSANSKHVRGWLLWTQKLYQRDALTFYLEKNGRSTKNTKKITSWVKKMGKRKFLWDVKRWNVLKKIPTHDRLAHFTLRDGDGESFRSGENWKVGNAAILNVQQATAKNIKR